MFLFVSSQQKPTQDSGFGVLGFPDMFSQPLLEGLDAMDILLDSLESRATKFHPPASERMDRCCVEIRDPKLRSSVISRASRGRTVRLAGAIGRECAKYRDSRKQAAGGDGVSRGHSISHYLPIAPARHARQSWAFHEAWLRSRNAPNFSRVCESAKWKSLGTWLFPHSGQRVLGRTNWHQFWRKTAKVLISL